MAGFSGPGLPPKGGPYEQDLFRDRLELQVGRAFIDLPNLGIAIELLDGVVLHESVSAKQVDREGRHAFGDLGREQLAHRGLAQERQARVTKTCGVVDEEPRRLEVGCHARELELHALEISDGAAELPALFGVANGVIQRALRQADHLRADADAPFVERLDGDLVALAELTEYGGARHLTILEDQLAGAARPYPELVLFLADREAGRPTLDDERRDAAIAGLGIHRGEDDEEVGFVAVGDPELAPRDRESVTAFGGPSGQRERVAPGSGL